ncbi:MAG: ORF6N domain-containing protein [Patescibacteria group bacterium]
METINTKIIPSERIASKIYIIRGRKVLLDRDLAALYCVKTKVLNQAVKRNIKRFPPDFMFQLTKKEMENWISQIVISSSEEDLRSQTVAVEKKNLRSQIVTSSWGGTRTPPFAFTEQGVAMLSSVLNSDRAIAVNIQIIRTFTQLRELLSTNEALQRKIMEIEQRYDNKLKEVFGILKLLLEEEKKPKEEIGFKYKEIK